MATNDAQKPVSKTAIVRVLFPMALSLFTTNFSDRGCGLLPCSGLVGEFFLCGPRRSLTI